jgi:adenylate cyclase
MKLLRRRQYPADWAAHVLLVSGAIVPTAVGSAVIAAMTFWALPTGAALGEQHILMRNVFTAAAYASVAVPAAIVWGLLWMTIPEDADIAAVGRRILLALPLRMAVIHGAVWTMTAIALVMVNLSAPWLAATLGVSVLLGAVVTTAVSYWMCERALRGSFADLLTNDPPTRPRRPGLRFRAVSAWVVGSGVPIVTLLLVAVSALVVDYPGHRLSWVVLAVCVLALVSGLSVAAFTGSTIADPMDEVRRGMLVIERGDYDVTVPVFDASELGMLQAGFNTMASGLRERERLRDLFGRHVGRDVARLAEEAAAQADSPPPMGGVCCDVAVMFVDLTGSSRLAARLAPDEFVRMLNEFFAVVVDVVEQNSGWVNKFEGDAALAIFGAPAAIEDAAGRALAAARGLNERLNRNTMRAGIGVSAGRAVAGNIGEPRRYEYTVVGDPVNEAARLSEFAKSSAGAAASGAALSRASHSEAERWRLAASCVLRGRDTTTDISVPRHPNREEL